MTIFQIALLAITIVMSLRQAMLIRNLHIMVAKYGKVKILPSWWVHLFVTVGLVVWTIVSFTGVDR